MDTIDTLTLHNPVVGAVTDAPEYVITVAPGTYRVVEAEDGLLYIDHPEIDEFLVAISVDDLT